MVTAILLILYLVPLIISWGIIGIYCAATFAAGEYFHPDMKLNLFAFGARALVPGLNWLSLLAMLM